MIRPSEDAVSYNEEKSPKEESTAKFEAETFTDLLLKTIKIANTAKFLGFFHEVTAQESTQCHCTSVTRFADTVS